MNDKPRRYTRWSREHTMAVVTYFDSYVRGDHLPGKYQDVFHDTSLHHCVKLCFHHIASIFDMYVNINIE